MPRGFCANTFCALLTKLPRAEKELKILVRKGPVVSRTSCSHTQMQKSDFFLLGMSEVLMVVVKFSHCISVEDLALSKHHYVHI